MIAQNIIDDIKNRADIVDLIGESLTLTKKGVNFWGVCPFHGDRSPSLCVSSVKQIYKCFACGEAGHVFDFLMKHENMSFPEAVRHLGRKYDIEVPERELSPEELQREKKKEGLRIALSTSNKLFLSNLQQDTAAQEYLSGRGIYSGENSPIEKYGIGLSGSGNNLLHTLTKSGYSKDILLNSGLIREGENGAYDYFRNRIMFPFFDQSGHVTGYTGRSLEDRPDNNKYMNSPDTELYKKGASIFGLFQAKQSIARNDKVFLVEGQFDVLSFFVAGIEHTVCGSGTALTDLQVKYLMRFTKNITLIYDGDKAGQKASVKNIQILTASGANVRAVSLPDGEDPDSFARKMGTENLSIYLANHEKDFATYLTELFTPGFNDPVKKEEALSLIIDCIGNLQNESLEKSYINKIAEPFGLDSDIICKKIREKSLSRPKKEDIMKAGFYGIEALSETLSENSDNCLLTGDFSDFERSYGEEPVIYFHNIPSISQIQSLRLHVQFLNYFDSDKLSFDEKKESSELLILKEIFKAGIQIYVHTDSQYYDFVDFYVKEHGEALCNEVSNINKGIYLDKCCELISFTSEGTRSAMNKEWSGNLGVTLSGYKDILKVYLNKRKSASSLIAQRIDVDNELLNYDPESVPDYVEEDENFHRVYRRHGFYPLLNREKVPVCYMFRNDKGAGHTQVADFYMIPLLHIYNADREQNKRVIQVNRLYSKKPIYLEVKSSALTSLNSFKEILSGEEAMNFENGNTYHYEKIKQVMSYNYIKCAELKTYGQQPENFFAFANAIFHEVDGTFKVDSVNHLGVVTHQEENYYLPAFSPVYASLRKDDDMYEQQRYFMYNDIPTNKQCTFEKWAALMDKVYKVNNNGKWAIIYAIMCAFRSDIHAIDRLFTALFFIGPTSSGKTQIAVSIRSLYIHPSAPAFNLNSGTDAAFFSLMEGFRDVPQVLDEYNNNDISDTKFQGLKSICYDGDGKQKRRGATGKDIETSKVHSPVVILGQETPQRDDNALMNRVIICEVPKPPKYEDEEAAIFQELKGYENTGLSNILIEILKLRPIVRSNFKKYQRTINKELTRSVLLGSNGSGDMVRIINTVSLFLSMCKIIMEHSDLKLPFNYDSFYNVAVGKVREQIEMISHTDKLSSFFAAMEAMINTGTIKQGRDFIIDQPAKLTLKISGNDRKETELTPSYTKVLHLRISTIYTLYAKSSFKQEETTQSTIEQNIRSNPAYIGFENSKRFTWEEVAQVPKGEIRGDGSIDQQMVNIISKKGQSTSCLALNYDIFRQYFDIDLERDIPAMDSGEADYIGLDETKAPF